MSYVSVIISGAASLGVLIGLISGIFFLVLNGLKWVSRVREALYEEELRRQKKINFNNANSVDSDSQDFLDTRKKENNFGSTFNKNPPERNSESYQSNGENVINWNESQGEEKSSEKQGPSSDTIQVREFIEKMVEELIGGPLDGTTVGQLSNHSAYLGMFTKYHNLLCRELARLGFALHLSVVRKRALELDSSNSSQYNLKRLIKRIVSEAMTLPNIKEILCRPKAVKEAENDDFKDKSYEDILATAILNKVIEHFQNKENVTTDGKPKPRPRSKKLIRNLDDDDHRSNSDWSDVSRSDQLSLTIEEYIEEVTTALEASEDERSDFSDLETNINRRIPFPEAGRTVVDGTDDENSDIEGQSSATELFTSTSTWEENWLFQKKRLRSTPNAHHPVPVPMLVPNPSEDYRALVGGVDADDLSDMSDCSELILEDQTPEEKPLHLSNNEFEKLSNGLEELDENENKKSKDDEVNEIKEKVPGSGIEENSNTSLVNMEENEHVTGKLVWKAEDESREEEISESGKLNSSPTSPSQKDRDFSFEHFDLLQQCEPSSRIESSLGTTLTSLSGESENGSLRSRIAEREKEKWNNAVPLADNPYSLENIEKRAQRRRNDYFRIGTFTGESIDFPEDLSSDELTKSTENLRFTRDYYVNASKNPSGKSSPALSQISKGYDQKPLINENHAEEDRKGFIMPEENQTDSKTLKINKKEFCLPNVKELAKRFTQTDTKESKKVKKGNEPNNKFENRARTRLTPGCITPEREPELDYSTTPVSEIVSCLQQNTFSSVQENKHVPYEDSYPKTQAEVCQKVDDDDDDDKIIESVRFNGKEVHSLTARSISKEFREGLKNNSCQNLFLRINRASVNGENEQRNTVHSEEQTSPTPSIDLKNMKKFWEELITANANATKQK